MIYPSIRKDSSDIQSPISPLDQKALPSEQPPAYVAGPSGGIPQVNRVNFFHVKQDHHSVEGSWTVDPSFQIPEAFLPSGSDTSKTDNLHLYSHHKAVSADLALISEVPCKSILYAASKHKEVQVIINKRVNQRFRLTASSKHKDVKVYLPRDFEGPITFKSGKGGPELSESVKQRLMMFGSDRGSGKAFMGRWDQMGDLKNMEDWTKDEALLSTKHGKLYISFADELDKPQLP